MAKTRVGILAFVIVFSIGANPAMHAQGGVPAPVPVEGSTQDSANDMVLVVGKSVLVDTAHQITRVAVGSSELAEATAVTAEGRISPHDLEMLMGGPYPLSLKERVAGRFGHLSNRDAGALLANLDRSKLRHVFAAHLSQQNNTPALAAGALAAALGCEVSWVGIATQAGGFSWREL